MRDQDDRGRMERDRNERDISIKGDIMMLGRKLVFKKFSGIHNDDPLRLLEIAERVSERAFPLNQIRDHPNCRHRTFSN